jgi:hypothetical protein
MINFAFGLAIGALFGFLIAVVLITGKGGGAE